MQATGNSRTKGHGWLGLCAVAFVALIATAGPDSAGAANARYAEPVVSADVSAGPSKTISVGTANALVSFGLAGIALFPYRYPPFGGRRQR